MPSRSHHPSYTTLSWLSDAVAGDDGYVDEIAALIQAIADGDRGAVDAARARVSQRRLPIQPVLAPARRRAGEGLGLTRSPGPSIVRRVYERDGYHCRYCGTRAIAPEVLAIAHEAGAQFDNALPCHPNWKRSSTHPVYYWQFATLEHIDPVSRGGSVGALENLVTACWPCQSAKGTARLEELGWRLLDVRNGAWDGLRGLLPRLQARAAAATPMAEPTAPVTATPVTNSAWARVSFHATTDGRDGALIAAALVSRAAPSALSSRRALRTTSTPDGSYYSLDGNWRVRRATPDDLAAAGRRPGLDANWLLEFAVSPDQDV